MDSDQITKEIKFAVVMYGGGSLAIYINGVAQELLKMVQATALGAGELSGTAVVYRKIALLLSDKQKYNALLFLEESIIALKEKISKAEDTSAQLNESLARAEDDRKALLDSISVRFVIDVLTGSSAGGINAVFLSKALANGANIEKLQDLWMTQGDFRVLLNDKNSIRDNNLQSQDPKSLLNSQRMYLELLKALDGMKVTPVQPLIKNLDLFVTFTDFRGVPLPIALTDQDILERRHRHIFNFRFDSTDGVNDFEREQDPFLAFAARSTSAFPIAFEPMKLTDIDDVLNASGLDYKYKSDSKEWDKYFRDAVDENGNALDWKTRSFVDGGALDNKPFSYAIDTLSQRDAAGIVERKLVFIDPFAEEFKKMSPMDKPNALENLLGQASGLPRYETIREDIERLIKRNRIIRRVKRLTAMVEEDFENQPQERLELPKDFNWADADLKDILKYKGSPFLLYYRLRISSVTDQIGKMASSYFRIDEDSNYNTVIRSLIGLWRDNTYFENKDPKNPASKDTLNTFLYLYDVEYRLRRLRQIMQRLQFLLDHISDIFTKVYPNNPETIRPADKPDSTEMSSDDYRQSLKQGYIKPLVALENALAEMGFEKPDLSTIGNSKSKLEAFEKEIRYIQRKVASLYSYLRRQQNYLQESLKSPLSEHLADVEEYRGLKEKVGLLKRSFGKVENILRLFELDEEISEEKSGKGINLNLDELRKLKDKLSSAEEQDLSDKEKAAFAQLSLGALKRISEGLQKNNSTFRIDDENRTSQYLKTILKDKFAAILAALSEAGDNLNKVYGRGPEAPAAPEPVKPGPDAPAAVEPVKLDEFLKRASEEMKVLLGVDKNNDSLEKDEFLRLIREDGQVLNQEYSYVIRVFLRNYYVLFDSYDQLSFPIYFETNVGEAVEVDIVRVSSRDATDLINEADDPRRKLAGDYLFSFGAFLDARWRQNDIMWGRLDGAEQLIKTLLADEKHKEYQKELIREANEIILKETMLRESGDAFNNTVAKALTFAAVEKIDKQPVVERLFKGMTPQEVEQDLIQALRNSLDPTKFFENVKFHYEVDRTLDPQPTLEIISRATQIGGKILEDIAETQAKAGNRLQWVTRLGSIFWGLVTVAAPGSIGNLLLNYWLQLLYLFEAVVIIGATLLPNSSMQQFGIVALVLTIVLHLTVLTLHDLMNGKNLFKLISVFFIILGALAAVSGVVFTYAFVFNSDFWTSLVNWHAFLDKNNYDRSIKLLFAGLLSIFVLALFGWRHARRLEIRPLGLILLLFTAGMLASGYGIKDSVSNMYQVTPPAASGDEKTNTLSPVLALEFARTRKDLDEIIKPAVRPFPQPEQIQGPQKSDEEKVKDNIDKLKTSVFIDSFIFVPLYALTFLLLAQLLDFRRAGWFGKKTAAFLLEIEKWRKYVIDRENKDLSLRDKFFAGLMSLIVKKFTKKNGNEGQSIQIDGSPWWFQRNSIWLAWTASLLILAAVAADCMENYLSYFVLDSYLNGTVSLDSTLMWKTIAAYVKFTLTFVALVFVLLNFIRTFAHPWLLLLFVLSLLLPLAGIVLLVMGRWSNIQFLEIISPVLLLLLAVQLIMSFVMIKLDQEFLQDF